MGDPTKRLPIHLSKIKGDNVFNFIDDSERILADVKMKNFEAALESEIQPESYERSGPHGLVYFEGAYITATIVTCGGL